MLLASFWATPNGLLITGFYSKDLVLELVTQLQMLERWRKSMKQFRMQKML